MQYPFPTKTEDHGAPPLHHAADHIHSINLDTSYISIICSGFDHVLVKKRITKERLMNAPS